MAENKQKLSKREYDKLYYQKNRLKIIAHQRRYYTERRNEILAKRKRRYLEWVGRVHNPKKDLVWKDAESFAVRKLLPSLGFSNIHNLNEEQSKFPFDTYAEKNGERFLIDVTTAPNKQLKDRLTWLWKALGVKRMVLFLKPDFSAHYLMEIKANKKNVWLPARERKRLSTL